MKKYLLKTLLVSMMTFGATSVWANASLSSETTVARVHGNNPTSKEIDDAREKLRLSIEEASEIQENGRRNFNIVTNAISVAQGVYDNNNATVEQLEGAIKTLTDAVKSFILANYSDLLKEAINLASDGNGVNAQRVVSVISNTNSILKADLKKAIIDALAVHLPGIEDLVDAIVEYVKDGQQSALEEAMEDFEAIQDTREKLRLSIEEVKEIKEAGRNRFDIITNAITVAQGVYDDMNATKESLEKAIKDLTQAVRNFIMANLPDETLQEAVNLASDGNGLNAQRVLNVIINTESTNWADLKQAIIDALAVHVPGIEGLVDAIVEYVKDGQESALEEAMEDFEAIQDTREKLRLSIEEVKEIKEAGRNRFDIITNALTVAQGVYDDMNATKESLEKAIKDLTQAVRSFIMANLPDETLQEAVNLASDGNGLNAQRVLNVIINTESTNWADLKQAIIDALAVHEQGIEDLVSAIVEYVKNGDEDKLQEAIDAFKKPTGISTITVNGQDDMVYNMAGQRVMNVKKGLYIINGKKQLMK